MIGQAKNQVKAKVAPAKEKATQKVEEEKKMTTLTKTSSATNVNKTVPARVVANKKRSSMPLTIEPSTEDLQVRSDMHQSAQKGLPEK